MGMMDIMKNCCFWVQIAGSLFFCVAAALVCNDSYYLEALTYEHKAQTLTTFCGAAIVFFDASYIKNLVFQHDGSIIILLLY